MFQEQKRIDASRICFFFGAAASKFGIPSMKEMTSIFANELREKGEKEEVEAFNHDLGLFILEIKGITDHLNGSELKNKVLDKLETSNMSEVE